MPRRPIEGLYALTPEGLDAGPLEASVETALAAGLRLLQFRAKAVDGAARERLGWRLRDLCARHGATFIVNDDPALARELGADGVHLGRDDGSVRKAREVVGEDAIIGVSCYDDLQRGERATAEGADYVAFGSFFASTVKPDAPRPGLEVLRRARATLDCPIVAIGGITLETAVALRDAGAHAVAVITDVFSAADIGARVRDYGRLFERAATSG